MAVPLLDLNAQFNRIEHEIRSAIDVVLKSQHFIMGAEVKRLESKLEAYLKTPHAYGCASGSDALLLALMVLDVQPGDLVITSPYTFFATGGAIVRIGAVPVFIDINQDDFNLDMSLVQAFLEGQHPLNKRFDRSKVKAVIPVHLYGQSADMDVLVELSKKYSFSIIEDAAQAIGTQYKGRHAGTIGDFGCYSFFPSKNLGGYGDGGLLTVQNELFAEKASIMRLHGAKPKYFHKYVGINSRLDTLQAAILEAKLPHLDAWNAARKVIAHRYNELFRQAGVVADHPKETCGRSCTCMNDAACGLASYPNRLITPKETTGDSASGGYHVYHQYVIRTHRRDQLMQWLNHREIGNAIYYPVPLHEQECFATLGYQPSDCAVSSCMARQTLALPIYPELSQVQQEEVVEAIVQFLKTQ